MDARGNLILVVVVIVLLPEGDWLRDWWNDFVGTAIAHRLPGRASESKGKDGYRCERLTAIVQNRSTSMGFFM